MTEQSPMTLEQVSQEAQYILQTLQDNAQAGRSNKLADVKSALESNVSLEFDSYFFFLRKFHYIAMDREAQLKLTEQGEQIAAGGLLERFHGEVQDFTDTAAIVAGLDAVVSIDSSVAHLAGALDRPVCLLLPEPAEWRWLRGVDRTEWYPRHRLLRQARPGDWTEPLRQLREELSRALAGRPRTP